MEYTTDEYGRAQDTVDLYDRRAIEVLRNCGVEEVLKWFSDCEDTFVDTYTNGETGESKVMVTLWMGYEREPMHRKFEFPWELMNTANVHIPNAYAKWRKEEDEKLAAKKAAKDKYWAEVRNRYENAHFGIEIIAKKDNWEHRLTCFDLVTVGMKNCVDACAEIAKTMSDNIKSKKVDGLIFEWDEGWEITFKALETQMPANWSTPDLKNIAKSIEGKLLQTLPD